MPRDTHLLTGGRIYRSARDAEPAGAILLRGDRVAWVGPADGAPEAGRITDLAGRTVLPGLTDAHIHVFTLALSRLQVPLARTAPRSLAALGELLRREAAARPDEPWLQGCELFEDALAERRLPTRADLDAAVPDRPVLLRRYCGHIACMNTRALDALGIGAHTPDPPGGHFRRDCEGRPDGIAVETAAEDVFRRAPCPPTAALRHEIGNVIEECLGHGLTALNEAAVGFSIGHDREAAVWDAARADGPLPVRMGFMRQLTAAEATERGLSPAPDPEWSAETLKFFADGILGGRTGALFEPYDDTGGRGDLIQPAGVLEAEIAAAHAAGWRVAVHATGDRGVACTLAALAAAQEAVPRPDPRHRIEHAFLWPSDFFARAASLGIVTVTQPSFLRRMGDGVAAGLGARMARAYPGASALAAGARLAFSSDAPTGLLSPWTGVAAAVDRCSTSGATHGAGEAMSRSAALDAYTAGGAYAMGQERWRGRLLPGGAADLAVFDRDPLTDSHDSLEDTRAVLVLVRGEIVLDQR